MGKVGGYDYGVRERIVAYVDPLFADLLDARDAVAYGDVPSFGVLVNPPALFYVFKNEGIARRCFHIFHNWKNLSNNNGDAVEITFIEFEDGSYGVLTGPHAGHLLRHSVPPELINDYQPTLVAPSKLIRFRQTSKGFWWFREAIRNRAFVVAPATHASGPIMELAFMKREVAFFKAAELPVDHPAIMYISRRRRPLRTQTTSPMHQPDLVRTRREQQLKRFFPVTLERLRLNPHFGETVATAKALGFEDWEVRQAVCNVTLRHRLPRLFELPTAVGEDAQRSVLGFLIEHPEAVDDAALPNEALTIQALEAQMRADRRYLLCSLAPAWAAEKPTDEIVDKELKRLGMV